MPAVSKAPGPAAPPVAQANKAVFQPKPAPAPAPASGSAAQPPAKPAITPAAPPRPAAQPPLAPIRVRYGNMPTGGNVRNNGMARDSMQVGKPAQPTGKPMTASMQPMARKAPQPMFNTGLNIGIPAQSGAAAMQPSIKRGSDMLRTAQQRDALVKRAQVMGPPAPKAMIQDQLQYDRDAFERRLNAASSANRWSRFFHNPLSLVGVNGGINAHGDNYDKARQTLQHDTGAGNWLDRAQDIGGATAGFRDWRATGRAAKYMKPGYSDAYADLVARQREALTLNSTRRRNRALAQAGQLQPPQEPEPYRYNPYPPGYTPQNFRRDYYSTRYDWNR